MSVTLSISNCGVLILQQLRRQQNNTCLKHYNTNKIYIQSFGHICIVIEIKNMSEGTRDDDDE